MSTTIPAIPSVVLPDQFNVATAFLDRNIAEGRGAKTAIYHEGATYTYAQVAELANRVGNGLAHFDVIQRCLSRIKREQIQIRSNKLLYRQIGILAQPFDRVRRETGGQRRDVHSTALQLGLHGV